MGWSGSAGECGEEVEDHEAVLRGRWRVEQTCDRRCAVSILRESLEIIDASEVRAARKEDMEFMKEFDFCQDSHHKELLGQHREARSASTSSRARRVR